MQGYFGGRKRMKKRKLDMPVSWLLPSMLVLLCCQHAHAVGWRLFASRGATQTPFVNVRNGPSGTGVWGVWTGSSYAYAVEQDPQHLLLINTGSDANAAALQDILKTRGYTLDAITDVILTDGRIEHTQGLQALPLHTNIWVSPQDASLARGDKLPRPLGAKLFARRLRIRHFKPRLQPVLPGQCFSLGKHQAQVVALPGYTRGALALVVDDMLFVGQSLQYENGAWGVANRWYSESPAQNVHALKRLERVSFRTILTSQHGPIFDVDKSTFKAFD